VASECRHSHHKTDTEGLKVQRRNLCGAMRPEQKQSCETRERDSANAKCEKEQIDNIFTQAVRLRAGYVAVTCGRRSRIAFRLSSVIGHS
jgi:hypothetical protein